MAACRRLVTYTHPPLVHPPGEYGQSDLQESVLVEPPLDQPAVMVQLLHTHTHTHTHHVRTLCFTACVILLLATHTPHTPHWMCCCCCCLPCGPVLCPSPSAGGGEAAAAGPTPGGSAAGCRRRCPTAERHTTDELVTHNDPEVTTSPHTHTHTHSYLLHLQVCRVQQPPSAAQSEPLCQVPELLRQVLRPPVPRLQTGGAQRGRGLKERHEREPEEETERTLRGVNSPCPRLLRVCVWRPCVCVWRPCVCVWHPCVCVWRPCVCAVCVASPGTRRRCFLSALQGWRTRRAPRTHCTRSVLPHAHTLKHTRRVTHTHTHAETHRVTHTLKHTRRVTHTHTHAETHTQSYTRTHAETHRVTRTETHTELHTHTHTLKHTELHTR